MASATPQEAKTRPNHRTIAFASSVVLSKPPELSVKEYIRLLQLHFAKGRRRNALSTAHRHLDRSAFWRSEYERIKEANRVLEDEKIGLKLELEAVELRVDRPKTASPTKKRKKVDEDVITVPRSPKKQKQETLGSNGDDISNQDFTQFGEIGNTIMRNIYDVHTYLKARGKTEPLVLAHHLVRAAAAVPRIVQNILEQSPEGVDVELLRSVIAAVSRSIQLLMSGLNRLFHVPGSPEAIGSVIYAFVQMYSKLLDCLETASLVEARRLVEEEKATAARKRGLPSKATQKQLKPTNIRDNPALSLISRFFCGILEGFDATDDAHKSLYEGFTYLAFNKLGARLYHLVFGYARGSSIDEEIAAYNAADEIEDTEESAPTSAQELGLRAAKLEAPYLIHLLSRIMNAAPTMLDAIVPNRAGKPKSAFKGSMKGSLAINAKDRMQRTLINCMFGEDSSSDEDPFRDCLRMPAIIASALPMPKIKEAEVQDWFKEEVWRLLGWEILSREGE